MTRASTRSSTSTALTEFAERMSGARTLRDGAVVLHFTDGTTKHLAAERGQVQVTDGPPPTGAALVEVLGDEEKITGILSGEKNALREFFAGGLRVRGDLSYLSDLGVELGVLRKPL